MQLLPVERIEPPSVEDFRRRYFRPRRPVVLAGGVRTWAALERWSLERLAERFGHLDVRAYAMPKGRIQLDPRKGFRVLELSLRDFVERLDRDDDDVRLFLRTSIDGRFAEVEDDMPRPAYCAAASGLRRNLWMSGAGIVTQLHFDLPDNLVAMVRGRKRFFVFAPAQRRHLDPYPWISSVPHLARVDPERADRFPRAAGARGWECEIGPGDVLYLPPRFWHHARSLEPSVSVNHWWCRPVTRGLSMLSDGYKKLRGLDI